MNFFASSSMTERCMTLFNTLKTPFPMGRTFFRGLSRDFQRNLWQRKLSVFILNPTSADSVDKIWFCYYLMKHRLLNFCKGFYLVTIVLVHILCCIIRFLYLNSLCSIYKRSSFLCFHHYPLCCDLLKFCFPWLCKWHAVIPLNFAATHQSLWLGPLECQLWSPHMACCSETLLEAKTLVNIFITIREKVCCVDGKYVYRYIRTKACWFDLVVFGLNCTSIPPIRIWWLAKPHEWVSRIPIKSWSNFLKSKGENENKVVPENGVWP